MEQFEKEWVVELATVTFIMTGFLVFSSFVFF